MARLPTYSIFVQKSSGGYTAVVPDLPGCLSQGATKKRAMANVCEAVSLYTRPTVAADCTRPTALSPAAEPVAELVQGLMPRGWIPVEERGKHIRLHNRIGSALLVMVMPLAADLLDSTLFQIMKRATADVDEMRKRIWGPQGRDKIQSLAKGARMRAVGSRIVFRPEEETFHEFLVWMLWRLLGARWFREQGELEPAQRHAMAEWYSAYDKWREAGRRPENEIDGGWQIPVSGDVKSLLSLAYDVYHVLHSANWCGKVFRRLRARDKFQGARYEMAVAAILSRLGYKLTYPKGGTDVAHPEFIARHPTTGREIAVEAKSRHRAGVLNMPGVRQEKGPNSREIETLFRDALSQCPSDLPAAIFIDLNVPPLRRGDSRAWFEELIERFKGDIGTSGPGGADSFNVLFLTNFPFHWVGSDLAPSTQHAHVISYQPQVPLPQGLVDEIYEAIANYGVIPDEQF